MIRTLYHARHTGTSYYGIPGTSIHYVPRIASKAIRERMYVMIRELFVGIICSALLASCCLLTHSSSLLLYLICSAATTLPRKAAAVFAVFGVPLLLLLC